jgi:hypothetical protein
VYQHFIDMANATAYCVGDNCFFSAAGRPPYAFFGASALLAGAVVVLQTGVLAFHVRGSGAARPQVLATFVLLYISAVLRGVWFSLRASDRDGVPEHFVNRFSVLLFFSGFSMYLQTWVRFVGATSGRLGGGGRASEVATTLRRACPAFTSSKAWLWNLGLNGVNWAVVFSLSFASEFGGCKPCKNWGYIVLSVECFLLSVGFLFFGSRMYGRLRDPGRRNARIRLIARKVLAVLCVCCVCFGVRSVFWLWEPISGKYSPEGTYPFMHYTVTGLVPSVVLFGVMAPAGRAPPSSRDGTSSSSLSNHGRINKLSSNKSKNDAEAQQEGKQMADAGVVGGEAVSVEIPPSA